jgi:hypothetical protein
MKYYKIKLHNGEIIDVEVVGVDKLSKDNKFIIDMNGYTTDRDPLGCVILIAKEDLDQGTAPGLSPARDIFRQAKIVLLKQFIEKIE